MNNNNIFPVKDIKDILDTWQDILIKQNNKQNKKIDKQDKKMSEIELDTISALMNMRMSKQDATRYVNQLYTPQDTVQSLTFKVLQSSGASK